MLKTGIVKKEELLDKASLFRRPKKVAYSLLDCDGRINGNENTIFEEVIKYVQLSDDIFRTTYKNRFSDIDPVVNDIIRKTFTPATKLQIYDWAVSDARTSCEWAESLEKFFPEGFRFRACDQFFHLVRATSVSGKQTVVFDPNRKSLQYIFPPFVVPLWRYEPFIYPVNNLIGIIGRKIAASILKQCSTDIFFKSLPQPVKIGKWNMSTLSLVHPQVTGYMSRNPSFELKRHNVFEKDESQCNVLRSMNILNLSYFDRTQLQKGIVSANGSLSEGGIWIVGRTHENGNGGSHVTVFRKHRGTLTIVDRIGNGAEIEKLIQEINVD